jgi:hypothetical protein
MLSPSQILIYVKAQPFLPFRVYMASGKTFDVRHPEMVKLGKSSFLIFYFEPGGNEVFDQWETVSLMLIESISHLDAPLKS